MTETATVAERRVVGVATLSSTVRLVVVQFLMPTVRVPGFIRLKPKTGSTSPRVPGKEVLGSTPDVNLVPLLFRVDTGGDYELVDVWHRPHVKNQPQPKKSKPMSKVRFVYCHKEHVKHDELFPPFVAKRDELATVMANLVSDNLWTVQGHLNPYCDVDGSRTAHNVLMLGCVARKQLVEVITVTDIDEAIDFDKVERSQKSEQRPVMVFEGGRDPLTNQGIGPKVLLSSVASKLKLIEGEVQLELRN